MKKELDFFYIGDSYGGNQDWCLDHMMQLGGCGAVTACDCSIYFKLRMGITKAYPGSLASPANSFSEMNLPKPLSVIDGEITMPVNVQDAPFFQGPGASN